MTKITQQQLDLIVSTAQNAPLQNMQHAAAVSDALQTLQKWVEYAQTCISKVEYAQTCISKVETPRAPVCDPPEAE